MNVVMFIEEYRWLGYTMLLQLRAVVHLFCSSNCFDLMANRFTLWRSVHSVFVSILQAHICPIDDDGLFKTRQGPMVQVLKDWMASPSVLSSKNHNSNIQLNLQKKGDTLVGSKVGESCMASSDTRSLAAPEMEVERQFCVATHEALKHVEVVARFCVKRAFLR